MHGTGQTTGIHYTAQGSTQDGFTDWIPFNPDGSANGDGVFSYSDNYYITSGHGAREIKVIWHRTQRFTLSNNGNNLTEQPTVTVCK